MSIGISVTIADNIEGGDSSVGVFDLSTMNTLDVARDEVSSTSTLSTEYIKSAEIARIAEDTSEKFDDSNDVIVVVDCSLQRHHQACDNSDNNNNNVSAESNDYGTMIQLDSGQLLFGYGALTSFEAAFNGSFNDSMLDFNDSIGNQSYIYDTVYPSGYRLPSIIIAAVVVTILMIIIVIGNMLVIIAIATEKALKNIQNWFIASLAVADFFLGLIIMPFSLANEIMGYWIFGYWWCDIHSAMDVLLCTASIMNLCLISLDRFWSITQAIDYLKKRTPARAAIMIGLVWVLSAVICIPPLLGWKRAPPEEEFPKCKVSVLYCPFF